MRTHTPTRRLPATAPSYLTFTLIPLLLLLCAAPLAHAGPNAPRPAVRKAAPIDQNVLNAPKYCEEPVIDPDARVKPGEKRAPASSPGDAAVTRHGNEVSLDLVVRYAKNRIGDDDVCLRSYNGGLVGPTIRVRPGDTLNVHLVNRLPPNPAKDPAGNPDYPYEFNSTNLHTHGMHVSPSGNADNVLLSIDPGQDFQYEIKIPTDHPAGTYWYHPHRHGSTAIQVASGMEGALIVEGDIDRVPAIAAAQERIFVFQQIGYVKPGEAAGVVEAFKAFTPGAWEISGRRTTVNGVLEPTIEMRPGEVQRWRFIDAGVSETLKVRLETEDGRVIPQHLFSMDGITTGRLEALDSVLMYPGYRADVLVRAGDHEGTYLLIDENTLPVESLHQVNEQRRVLARVHVSGAPVAMSMPGEAELAPLAPFKSIRDEELTGKQKVEFAVIGPPGKNKFVVDGKVFDPSLPPRKLPLGGVEEWTVKVNLFQGHPFHIHVNPFEVIEPNGRRYWKDTIFVPRGQTVKLRTRYKRYIGTFVLHCHILDHEDMGMMQLVEVVPPGSAHSHHVTQPVDRRPHLPRPRQRR